MDKIDFTQQLNLLPTFDSNLMSKDQTPIIFIPLEYSNGQFLNATDATLPVEIEPFPLEIQDECGMELLDFVEEEKEEERTPPPPIQPAKRRKKPPRKRASKSKSYSPSAEKSNSYVCELCDEQFHLPNLLRLHKRALHVLTKPYRCEKCPGQFNMERNFEIHAASHAPMPAICSVCGGRFRRTTGYQGHLIGHMIPDNFGCKKCGTEFEYEEYFRRHLMTCQRGGNGGTDETEEVAVKKRNRNPDQGDNDTAKKFQCSICQKRFTRPSNLARHQTTHSQSKPFQCTVCQMRFSQKSSLERHSDMHLGVKGFKCPKCSMNFSQSGNLRTHMARVHPKNPDLTNKFPCPDCSCIFNKLNTLNRHSAMLHAVQKSTNIDSDENYSIDNVMAQLKNLQNFYPATEEDTATENCSLFPTETVETPILAPSIPENDSVNRLVKIVETLNPQEEKSEIVVNQVEKDSNKFYSCGTCSKSFQRPYDLLRHNRVHTNEKPYDCGICGRCFALKQNLHVHLRSHGKDADRVTNCYECPDCFKLFSSLRQLDMHAESHGDRKLFPCKICGKSFRFTKNLRIHRYTHRPKTNHELELRKSMKSPIEIQAVANQADAEDVATAKRFQCSICGLKFGRGSYLAQHEANHSGVKRFQCQTCKKSFRSRNSLNTHHRIHLDHRKTKQCGDCDAKFRSNTELKRHRVVHSTKRSILCPYCGKAFKTREACRVHIFTHAKDLAKETVAGNFEYVAESTEPNPDENVFYVSIELPATENQPARLPELQDTGIVQADELQTMQIIQAGILPPAAAVPWTENPENQPIIQNKSPSKPRSFIEMQDLIKNDKSARHLSKIITVHAIEKPPPPEPAPATIATNRQHLCEICQKSFRKPIDYRRHQLIHTQEKPFECDICQKTFRLKGTLDHHRRIHGEKRELFDCQVCGKSYTSRNVLKVHLRIHTNERPYSCSYCAKTFRTSGHRAIHVRMHLKAKETGQKKKRKEVKLAQTF